MMVKAAIKNKFLSIVLGCFFSLSVPIAASEEVQRSSSDILFSVRPLAILYIELTGLSVSENQILVSAGKNLHDYHLSLSEVKRVSQAKLVFWMGPQNETMLVNLAKKDSGNQKWLPLADTQHQWLSWREQIVLIHQFSLALQQALPALKGEIISNEALLVKRINAQFGLWRQAVLDNNPLPVLMAHSAFTPWVAALSMPAPVYYSTGHSHGKAAQGGRQSLKIQQRIANKDIICAIEEPDAHFDQLEKKFPQLNTIMLEPMADSQPLKKGAWMQFWQHNWHKLSACMLFIKQ
ncbi:MAG: zinc ABC transporter substrate-binding protein [Sinobacterium sp.]|nr:zinc ABC transporter substrate-binding protein [Sinobacterium sp.]